MNAVLHYIYDPLCGWCYGAEPLVWAASKVDGLALRLHAGGLWPQPTRLPDHMREYIQQADARVGQMSGQPYGEPYLNGLLFDPELVLESRPVIAAVLAAQSLDSSKALPMLRAIQHAHYERGQHVVREATLREIAVELGLRRSLEDGARRRAHFAVARAHEQRRRAGLSDLRPADRQRLVCRAAWAFRVRARQIRRVARRADARAVADALTRR
jgi:putative protein-disulfide isomerase